MQSRICILVSIFKLFCVCSVSKNVCNWIHTLGNLMINWHQMLACHIQKFHKLQHEEGTRSEDAKQWCPPTQILTYTSSYKNSQLQEQTSILSKVTTSKFSCSFSSSDQAVGPISISSANNTVILRLWKPGPRQDASHSFLLSSN